MTKLTHRIIGRVSSRPTNATQFSITGSDYDYAIGGLPFLSAVTHDRPLQRVTAPYKREQLDTDAEPGEQTLVAWWTRAQSSFHAGTGLKFEEPDQNYPNNIYRFQDSLGVDPWTIGQVTLLPATKLNKTVVDNCFIRGCIDGNGADMYLQAEDATLARVTDGASTAITWGGINNVVALADDGTNYFAADSVGIWKGALTGGTGAKIWNTGNTNVAMAWVKQRLMVGVGAAIYDLDPSGTGGPLLPTAKYTHPNPQWQWTAIAETPNDILAAGYVGAQSAVYRFTLSTAGVVPTLTAAITAMEFPSGERVYSLYSYLGDYVAVGTNKGVRIASVDGTSGAMQYGPLSIISTQPVRSITGKDRFIYAACENQLNGLSGVWRLDMGTQVAFRRFAFATDLQTHVAGAVKSIGQYGASGRLVISVDGSGSYLQESTALEPTGWVQTGNIRFHTLEPKLFKFVRLRVQPLAGSISVSVLDHAGSETNLASYSTSGMSVLDETATNTNLGPQEFVSLRVTLNRDAVATGTGPTFIGYQMKALPAAKRQRNFIVPLMCFDREKDKHGASLGGEGTAVKRLEALEALEEVGNTVLFQDLNRDPTVNRLCVVDEVKFVQDSPPANASGWGGYIYVTLRAVD